jgi:DNA-binding response OmpR family regulator
MDHPYRTGFPFLYGRPNGLELVRTLRAQGATMPILVLSSEPRVGETILAASADHFLLKPVARGMFTQILRTLLPDDEETRAIGQGCSAMKMIPVQGHERAVAHCR